tara:strand:+ start:465 stop:617 length:153 start_codon:yes stop_codon:yes gene_type:complete
LRLFQKIQFKLNPYFKNNKSPKKKIEKSLNYKKYYNKINYFNEHENIIKL